jgi:hypothetical protein
MTAYLKAMREMKFVRSEVAEAGNDRRLLTTGNIIAIVSGIGAAPVALIPAVVS